MPSCNKRSETMDTLVSARSQKLKSSWDREAALFSLTKKSSTHERLYGDATGEKRTARAMRERERRSRWREEPLVKPEGYKVAVQELEEGIYSRRPTAREVGFKPKETVECRGRDGTHGGDLSKKKADFGAGHPMWSPYYRPKGKDSEGESKIRAKVSQASNNTNPHTKIEILRHFAMMRPRSAIRESHRSD